MSYIAQYSAQVKKKILASLFLLFLLAIGLTASLSYLGNSHSNIAVNSHASFSDSCRDNPVSAPSGMKWAAHCEISDACVQDSDCQRRYPGKNTRCYTFEGATKTSADYRCLTLDPETTVNPNQYLPQNP